MIEIEGRTILAEGFCFTECPRWRDGWLYFSDMYGRTVYRLSESGAVEEVVRVEDRPGGLGFAPDGDLLISEMDAGRILRLHDGALSLHSDLARFTASGTNDMVVSPEGRCYVAKFSHGLPPPTEPMLFVDEHGEGREVSDPLKVANGMVLTADGRTLIVAESAGGRISAFDLDAAGVPGPRRTFAELPPVTHRVSIDDDRFAYACALGGADGRTLFICTAGAYVPDQMTSRRNSRIEIVRAPFAGQGIP